MQKTIFAIAAIVLAVNLLCGALISTYPPLNLGVSSSVVVITALLIWGLGISRARDAFKVSLSMMFMLAGAVAFFIGVFMPDRFDDNWGVITIAILIALQLIALIGALSVSKNVR